MFIDANELTENTVLKTDICIIGAGAAGISIARELRAGNKDVIVLESGGLEFDQSIQYLYAGENTGFRSPALHVNRLRYFGGTTNHWAGHSRPLDAFDFMTKSWIPYSGWPINLDQLEPFYQRAQHILDLGGSDYEDLPLLLNNANLPVVEFDDRRLKTVVYGQSPPTRFGKKYRDELKNADNVRVYLHATVVNLKTNPAASIVEVVEVSSYSKIKFTVIAPQIILAAGGLENARLLLVSNQIRPEGLGNEKSLVGRFFMDHITLRYALDVSFTDLKQDFRLYHAIHEVMNGKRFAVIAASPQLLEAEKLTNFRAHVFKTAPRYSSPIGGVFSRLDDFKDKNPLKKQRNNSIGLFLAVEPIPNPDSVVSLSNTLVDGFGQPRLKVHWEVSQLDYENTIRALEILALEFGRLGIGRGFSELFLDSDRWPEAVEPGKHHCGTTRMAASPDSGVVDANCKVFGINNLYVAGSSVFPTIGYANPTLTIVALALRLVEHIQQL